MVELQTITSTIILNDDTTTQSHKFDSREKIFFWCCSPSFWPYICVAVRPEILPYSKVECKKSSFIFNKTLKFETLSLGACLQFMISIKYNFTSSPYVFNINKIKNMYSNAYFSIPDLDFAVFQRNTPDIN